MTFPCSFLLLVLWVWPSAAQHGTAPPGYYPPGYNGDMWTGVVTATSDNDRSITLNYAKKDKTQIFVGELEEGYKIKRADGTMRELKVSEIPLGARLEVLYMVKTRKVDNKKVKVNVIFRLRAIGQLNQPDSN